MAIFLAEAPGSTNKELIIRSPTQLTVRVTTTAIVHVNRISINNVLIPRLFAREVFKLVISSLLKIKGLHPPILSLEYFHLQPLL